MAMRVLGDVCGSCKGLNGNGMEDGTCCWGLTNSKRRHGTVPSNENGQAGGADHQPSLSRGISFAFSTRLPCHYTPLPTQESSTANGLLVSPTAKESFQTPFRPRNPLVVLIASDSITTFLAR
jgi:hypothetical protein